MKQIVIILILIVAGLVFFFIPKEEKIQRAVVAVGLKAPDFELPELDAGGKSSSMIWRFSELKGKVVFINFWASWCDECKKEKPAIQMLYEKMQGRPFQMLTIVYRDAPEKAMAYMRENGYTMPVLFDGDMKIARNYGVRGVPETYIIDREGIVREKIIGRRQWDSPEAIELIEKWLK
ncbi:MAG: TlpA family protein disulfide reductase [Nitrospirae bacterium]|nr:TlpA family protein disulfide reductase [Nitrospirota bacterium]MDA8339491.1 TlpA disulfide reductase family protein [Nitrospiraceae bacterium]